MNTDESGRVEPSPLMNTNRIVIRDVAEELKRKDDKKFIDLEEKKEVLENKIAEVDLLEGSSSDLLIQNSESVQEVPSTIQDITTVTELTSPDELISTETLSRICNPEIQIAEMTNVDISSLLNFDQTQVLNQKVSKQKNNKGAMVGVYYYPWYGSDFHGGKYVREKLLPRQFPSLGEYNDKQCEVIAQHLVWSRTSNIKLWATSWWGPNKRTDKTLRDNILTNPLLGDMKIAIHYETPGRTKFNSTSDKFTSLHNVGPDFSYMAENYFDHPNYYRINNKPVVVIYLSRSLAKFGMLQNATEIMRSSAAQQGHDIYIIGDYNFGTLKDFKKAGMEYLDAVTNFDAYGSMRATGYVGKERLNDFYKEQEQWQKAAQQLSVGFVPAVTPGYNDKAVRDGNSPLSRKIEADAEYGSLFQNMLENAIDTVDKNADNLILINSFNEWHEDTQIEPMRVARPTALNSGAFEILSSPNSTAIDYTEGLLYEGYGTRYLDILRDVTV